MLWRFGRPHTVIGTSVGIVAIYAVAVAELAGGDLTADLFDLARVLLAGWCVNVFIVGINQVEDVEIDRINKPERPIAAGELSVPAARRIVACCALSCWSRWRSPRAPSSWCRWAPRCSSAPPTRARLCLKRRPLVAALRSPSCAR